METFKGRDTTPPCVKMILKHILEQINEMEVKKYCGKRYERAKSLRNGKEEEKL
ncbi:MAG: hypothetical protein SBU_001295 [Candidatus Syntrophoarchaeum butanivorans]|uniref:Uncharacterized protein n=1 Tax=Candidatus Syntropharchaeum butanivorans TaxID=1839936 RepID=A0A1F2P5E1_9EURY|nr:MAG: hypothetical protein SBU_001295 [Candidatus Syntrophoarchaeum butanivorans]